MSQQITTSMVNQFSANVFHLSQQKASRLRPYVRSESQKAEVSFYDRIGTTTAQKKVGRHSDTTYIDTPYSRRAVTMADYFMADLVDKEDKLRIIHNPESEYTQSFMMAMGRALDDVIIAGLLNPAQTGKDGSVAVSLPNSQKLAAVKETSPGTTGEKFSVKTLRLLAKKFNELETGDDERYLALTAAQLESLLGETQVTSSDFNTVKALVDGAINTFMGFKFIRTERLPVTTATVAYNVTNGSVGAGTGTMPVGSRRCIAWQKLGILLAVGKDVEGKISELPEKHYAKQIYACMTFGAVRMEEEKVIEVLTLD
jgi:hypothetical protein